jgi:starvation-inducible DNA-binding protein
MHSTRLDIPSPVRAGSIRILQARLSDALDLEAQMKQAHWNVRGPAFFQLHKLFDSLHDAAEGYVDLLAERITTLGGVADGRVQTTAAATSLAEYPLTAKGGEAHLRAAAAGLSGFGQALRANIDEAAQLPDADTADVLTEVSRGVDQQLWFVEAHFED